MKEKQRLDEMCLVFLLCPALFLCKQRLGGCSERQAMTEQSGLVGGVPALCRASGEMTFSGRCHPKPLRASSGAGRCGGGPSSGINGILLPSCARPAPPASFPARPAQRGAAPRKSVPPPRHREKVFLQKCSSHGRALGQTLSFTLRLTSQA